MGYALDCTYLHKIDKLNSDDIINEVTRLDQAFQKSLNQLRELKEKIVNDNTVIFEFLDSHIALLKDRVFYSEVVDFIRDEHCNAEFAFQNCIDKYINNLKVSKSIFLKDRTSDILDIKTRVLDNLLDYELEYRAKRSTILVVNELLPTRVLNLSSNIRGIIALHGGKTSHSAILCKSMGITYVVCEDFLVNNNDSVIIDTKNRVVIAEPDDKTILEYEYLYFDRDIDDTIVNKKKSNFLVKANISSNQEIKKVLLNHLDGVGLYRTEFLFMAKGHISNIDEQKAIYEEASQKIYPNEVVIRTFDIGDDKNIPYLLLESKKASNYFKYLGIFENQVRAICKANTLGNLRIMFPMIEEIEEFNSLKEICEKIAKEENTKISIGMMLETKKAMETIDDFKNVPFMSIGTNDLMSELYGINRLSIQNYDIYIDDLIERLKLIVDFAKRNKIELSLCGEIGAYEKYLVRLIDIGINIFSVNLPSIANVVNVISKKALNKDN